MRHRNLFLIGLTVAAAVASYLTDPGAADQPKWASTALGILALLQGVWAIGAAHWGRKALTDYEEADQRTLFRIIVDSPPDNPGKPIGAGLALVALSILFVGLLMAFAPRAHAATLPAGFYKYGPQLCAEQRRFWAEQNDCPALQALVEQETCPSLKSASCWNPAARLKTSREEGGGLGQLTRAYRADGSVRFDALADLRKQYGAELGGLSWDTLYVRPDLQMRGLVLMSRDAARPFRGSASWLQFGDAGYNGGIGGTQNERRACNLSPGCDPNAWFGNVELHCLKSRQPLYGGRSACDINREHTRNVFLVRRAKYAVGGLIWAACSL